MSLNGSLLRPAAYQLIPLVKILKTKLNSVLIADGVGVGKTISAGYIITYLSSLLNRPSLVICNPGLVEKWMLELQTKFGKTVITIQSSQELPAAISETMHEFKHTPVYVMSNTLLRDRQSSELRNISVIVFDEIHNYRNPLTLWHKGAVEVSKVGKYRVGLSATPIQNTILDLASELCILIPSYDLETMKAIVEDLWRTERISLSLPLFTRFIKEKLGIHFAKRVIREQRIAYSSKYYSWVKETISRVRGRVEREGYSFETITLYRLASSSLEAFCKATGEKAPPQLVDEKIKAIKQVFGTTESTHILVFCEFKDTVEQLSRELGSRPIYVMTGDTPVFDRMTIIEEFSKEKRAALVMTSVGSEGLDLQFADTVVNYDLHWNPMKIEQRVGRIDRIGQRKNEIQIINFVIEGSIDERVMVVLGDKLGLISGSVFQPKPIIKQTPRKETLFVETEVLESEVSTGRKLIEALEWTSHIPESDYKVLDDVDTSYCDPKRLEYSAKHDTKGLEILNRSDTSIQYLLSLSEFSKRLSNLLKYYS